MLPDGRSWRAAIAVAAGVGLAGGVLGVVVAVSITRNITFGVFTGDSSRAVVDDWYAGLLSDLGVVIWSLGAVAAFVAALVNSRQKGPDAIFFAGMGSITAWLAADDAFLWHEELIPDRLGVDENVVFAVYGLVAVVAILGGRRSIARNLWWLFAVAGVLLAGSLVVERIGLPIGRKGGSVGVLKFLGIAAWTAFFVEAAVHRIRRPTRAWPAPRPHDVIDAQNLSG